MPERELQTRAHGFSPVSIDEKARTFECVASTGALYSRIDDVGFFDEELIITEKAIDLSRQKGMPLLDSHRSSSLGDVLGQVLSTRVEGGKLIMKVKVSETREDIWRGIKDGTYRNVSIGYKVDDFADRIDRDTGRRVRTVLKLTLVELSLVPVGADAEAQIRNLIMPQENQPGNAPAPATQTPPAPATMTRGDMNREIRAFATTANLGAEFANSLIDQDMSIEQARTEVLAEMQRSRQATPPAPHVTVVATHDAPDQIITRMGEALYATRANPRHQLSEAARPYVNMTTLDMARECLRVRGFHYNGFSPADTIKRALQTTSDFSQVFADTANRTLRASYQSVPSVLKQLAREATARDFRAKTKVQMSDAPTLLKVNEAGEYKYGALAEASESYKIDTFGRIIALSRKAIINDDLGAFNDLSSKFGQAAADFEAQFLLNLLESNTGNGPTMGDGKALFHADHGNKAESGAALSEATLSAARLAMRKQKGLSGKPINITPKFLVVPPELETTAEKLLSAIQASKTDDVNPFGGKLSLLVDARLSDDGRWYAAADPATIEGLEYSYLQGEEGPQTETRAGFEVDGVEIKVRLDFGAAFLDWRGWYMNGGA